METSGHFTTGHASVEVWVLRMASLVNTVREWSHFRSEIRYCFGVVYECGWLLAKTSLCLKHSNLLLRLYHHIILKVPKHLPPSLAELTLAYPISVLFVRDSIIVLFTVHFVSQSIALLETHTCASSWNCRYLVLTLAGKIMLILILEVWQWRSARACIRNWIVILWFLILFGHDILLKRFKIWLLSISLSEMETICLLLLHLLVYKNWFWNLVIHSFWFFVWVIMSEISVKYYEMVSLLNKSFQPKVLC